MIQRLDLADEALDRLRPLRIADHDVAGAGRKAEALERLRERRAEAGKLGLRNRRGQQRPLSWSVRTVCSPRPSEPMIIRQPASRIAGGAIRSNSLTKSRRLRSEVISAIASTLHALPASRSTCCLDILRGLRQVRRCSARGRCGRGRAANCRRPGRGCRCPRARRRNRPARRPQAAACCGASSAAAPRR